MEVCVQLKICENCGCLWFRALTQESVYCRECEEKLRAFPAPETRKRPGRKSRKPVMKIWAVAEEPRLQKVDCGQWIAASEQLPLAAMAATGGAE